MIAKLFSPVQQRRPAALMVRRCLASWRVTAPLCLVVTLRAQTPINTFPLSGNVGIGTTTPFVPLDLGAAAGIKELIYGSGRSSGYQIGFGVDLGQAGNALSVLMPGGALGTLEIVSPNQTTWPYSSYTTHFVVQNTGNVGIGTTNPSYPLSVNGAIQAKEILVNTGWSDYVFDPSYPFAPLSEVALHARGHHHLPKIPSAVALTDSQRVKEN